MKYLPKNPTRFLYPPTPLTDSTPRFRPRSTTQLADPQPQPSSNRVDLYLHRARLIDAIRVHLRSHHPSPPLNRLLPYIDSFVATHALRSAPSPDSALSLFQTLEAFSLSQNTPLSQTAVHAMAKRLSLSGRRSELQTLISAMKSREFRSVLPPSPMDLLRWYAAAGDVDAATRAFEQIRAGISGKNLRHPCTESYNIMMNLYAQNGQDAEAVSVFLSMVEEGANPNSRTYTVAIEHLVRKGKLDEAMEVFTILPSMRIRRTTRQFSVLADGFAATGRFDSIKRVISEMKKDGILPGRSLLSSVMKLKEAGFVEETEELAREFEPDKRIGNLGFSISNEADEDEVEDEIENCEITLKPWLDPSALASALSAWTPSEVSSLKEANFVWTSRIVCKLLRAFKNPGPAWDFFCWVAHQPGGFAHDVYTVSRMIVILARHGCVELVSRLLSNIKREGIRLSLSTARLVIDSYGVSKQADGAIWMLREISSVCGPASKFDLGLLYSSLLRTLAKCRRSSEVLGYLDEMVLSGISPDVQTFCGLMQYFALEGDLRTVHELFGKARQNGIEADAYMYQILIRAYCKRERAALGLRVFEDMWARGLKPDVATKGLLVKSLWKEGKLREAAGVEERCEEVEDGLPVAVPGHVWTVSYNDFSRISKIYLSCFPWNGCSNLS